MQIAASRENFSCQYDKTSSFNLMIYNIIAQISFVSVHGSSHKTSRRCGFWKSASSVGVITSGKVSVFNTNLQINIGKFRKFQV